MTISRRIAMMQIFVAGCIGELLKAQSADAETVDYHYDELGRLKNVTRGADSIGYDLDPAGNRLCEGAACASPPPPPAPPIPPPPPAPTPSGIVLLDSSAPGSGNLVVPANTTAVSIEVWGGGGGGKNGGSGGGGAGYARRTVPASSGLTINYTIGAGGNPSLAGGATTANVSAFALNAGGGLGGTTSRGSGVGASGGELNIAGNDTYAKAGASAGNGGGSQTTNGALGTFPGGGGAGTSSGAAGAGRAGRILIKTSW